MSGIISITSRRLPRNVLSLGMQAARSQEVKSANVVRQYARLATVQAQLFAESQSAVTVSRPLGVMASKSFHTSVSLWNLETIKVPPFADSVSEGDVKFTCKVGDYVKVDQTVMEIETDKTTVGVPAPFGGIIKEILVSDGDTVKAGQALFKLEKADAGAAPAAAPKADTPPPPPAAKPAAAAPPPPPAAKPAAAAAPPPPKPAAPRPPPPPPAAPSASIPSASIPRAPGIVPPQVKVPPSDYSRQITGTRTEQRVKMNRMRQKIAARLKEAQNVNAMLTTFNEIDMSGAMAFRKEHLEAFQKKFGIKIGFMSIFTKAAAYALQDQPVVNAVIDGAVC